MLPEACREPVGPLQVLCPPVVQRHRLRLQDRQRLSRTPCDPEERALPQVLCAVFPEPTRLLTECGSPSVSPSIFSSLGGHEEALIPPPAGRNWRADCLRGLCPCQPPLGDDQRTVPCESFRLQPGACSRVPQVGVAQHRCVVRPGGRPAGEQSRQQPHPESGDQPQPRSLLSTERYSRSASVTTRSASAAEFMSSTSTALFSNAL